MMVIFSLILLLLAGICVVKAADPQNRYAASEKLMLGYGAGAGLISQIMLWLTLGPNHFTATTINLILSGLSLMILTIATILRPSQKAPSAGAGFKKSSPLMVGIKILIILQIAFVVCEAGLRPTYSFDAIRNWAFKSKVFFVEKGVPLDPRDSFYLGGDHPNYPLHLPFLGAWLYLNLGRIYESAINLLSAGYFAALAGLIYLNLKKHLNADHALVFCLFLVTMPLLLVHGFDFYADLALAFYFTAAAIYFYNYFNSRYVGDLLVAAAMAGQMVFVKNVGLFLALAMLGLFAFFLARQGWEHRSALRKYSLSLALFAGLSLPWTIFKQLKDFGYSNVGSGAINFGSFHPQIIKPLLSNLFFSGNFYIWFAAWLGFVLVYVVTGQKKQNKNSGEAFVLTLFAANFASFVALYLFSESYQFVMDGTLDSRNMMTLLPLSVFAAGVTLRTIQGSFDVAEENEPEIKPLSEAVGRSETGGS